MLSLVTINSWPLMTMMKQQKKHARVYSSLLYSRHGIGSSNPTSTASPLIKSERPPVACMNDAQWCALVQKWSSSKNKVCVCELIYFLYSIYVVYLCCILTQLWL
jgi:hypothetical protein